ncbi:hypothetical protein DUI87_00682 [Hirundo rustica rustica]|uniref:Uncharacterized protein n=1 Tax=Hirundo rustica rustica TaxID=333673 RepID=A0A3M0LHD1_HIRRU|nr:hypothetical protein DUI87_00682 [Hirundo rustica rustica]
MDWEMDSLTERSPADKDVRVLVHEKLDTRHQGICTAQKPNCILGCIKSSVASWSSKVRFPLEVPTWSTHEDPPGVSKTELFNTRHGPVGVGPEKGHKDDQRDGAHLR